MTMYLLGAVVRIWRRMFKGGIDRWERGRLRSIAAASAPLHGEVLAPADRELVDAHHAIYTRTDELPIVAPVRRRHVYRPPNARQLAAIRARQAAPRQAFAADPLSAPLAGPLAAPVLLASVPVSEPPAWHLESFTEQWTTGEIRMLIANAKAGAAR